MWIETVYKFKKLFFPWELAYWRRGAYLDLGFWRSKITLLLTFSHADVFIEGRSWTTQGWKRIKKNEYVKSPRKRRERMEGLEEVALWSFISGHRLRILICMCENPLYFLIHPSIHYRTLLCRVHFVPSSPFEPLTPFPAEWYWTMWSSYCSWYVFSSLV